MQAGSRLVYVMAEDNGQNPARNRTADTYRQRGGYDGPGIWVGDGDSRPNPGGFRASPLVEGYPSAFVVRTRDMQVITHQGLSEYVLPFSQIVNHLDADWSNPAQPDVPATCDEGDEEEYEPNDDPAQAAAIEPGSFEGGICAAAPDFFTIDVPGDWRLDLEFRHGTGDLDAYVFDPERGDVFLDRTGAPVGSDTTDDNESFEHRGPAMIIILGYQGATAPYRFTLTEL